MVSTDRVYPSDPRSFISFMLAEIIRCQSNSRLLNEFVIERVRASHFPDKVSRLRGLYFFSSRREAEARIGDRDWPPFFRTENLIELELHPTTVTKVDSDWITHAPREPDGLLDLVRAD
jgi:hypothetical protein